MPSGNNFWGRAVREESGLRKSKEKGTEEFFILFEITRGEFVGQDGKPQSVVGKRYGYDGWLTPNAKERTLQSLIYCGLDVRGGATLQNPIGIDRNEVPLSLEEETYSDPNEPGRWKTRTRVNWVNDPARGTSIHTRMNEAEAAAFSQKMQGELEATYTRLRASKTERVDTSFDFGANAPVSQPTSGAPAPSAQQASQPNAKSGF